MATKRWVNLEATKGGTHYIAGVPLDDLSDEQYDALPEWQQKQVDSSGLYRKTAPAADKKTNDNKKEQEG